MDKNYPLPLSAFCCQSERAVRRLREKGAREPLPAQLGEPEANDPSLEVSDVPGEFFGTQGDGLVSVEAPARESLGDNAASCRGRRDSQDGTLGKALHEEKVRGIRVREAQDWIEKLGLAGEFASSKGKGITVSSINDFLDALDHEARKGTKASAEASMVREGQEGPSDQKFPEKFDPNAPGIARGLEFGTQQSSKIQHASREAHLLSLFGQPYLDSIAAKFKEGNWAIR